MIDHKVGVWSFAGAAIIWSISVRVGWEAGGEIIAMIGDML